MAPRTRGWPEDLPSAVEQLRGRQDQMAGMQEAEAEAANVDDVAQYRDNLRQAHAAQN